MTTTGMHAYEQQKFLLADAVRTATRGFASDDPRHARARELLAQIASDRLNVVVIGRFNRGKTSLMNALLGGAHLPVGVVPVTSAITTVLYGSTIRVLLRYRGGGLPQDVPLDSLADYVTQSGNPGNARALVAADVYLPVDVLRRGLALVDTPGIGSAIAANTQTTEGYFPDVDVLLLVTSYESPLSEDEVGFLERARDARLPVFVALNKHDVVSDVERAEVQSYVRERLLALGLPLARLFSVSARQALIARDQSPSDVDASGVPDLELALIDFLVTHKNATFLDRVTERVRSLAAEAGSSAATAMLVQNAADAADDNTTTEQHLARDVAATQVGRCRLCVEVSDAVFAFLCHYQYELSSDDVVRRHHAATFGFCAGHTWQYEALASPRGVAASYGVVLHAMANALRAEVAAAECGADLDRRLAEALPLGRDCPACRVQRSAETEGAAVFAGELRNPEASDRHTQSLANTICLWHLGAVLHRLHDRAVAVDLVQRTADAVDRVGEDLQRFSLRFDALRRDLVTAEERRAPGQALALLVGERQLFIRRTDGPR